MLTPTIALVAAMAVPLYSDEIAFSMWKGGPAREGLTGMTLFPQCTSQWDAEVPAVLVPGAFLWAALFPVVSAWGLKVSGLLIAAMSLILMFVTLRIAGRDREWTTALWVFAAGVSLLGVLPLLLAMARAEQMVLLCVILLCLLGVWWDASPPARKFDWLGVLGVFLITSLVLHAHPKALFFLPVAGVALLTVLSRRRGWIKAASIGGLAVMGIEAFRTSSRLVACPEDAFVAELLQGQSVDLSAGVSGVAGQLLKNLVNTPLAVAEHLTFQSEYQSQWILAPGELGALGRMYSLLIVGLIVLVLVMGTVAVAVTSSVQIAKSRRLATPYGLSVAIALGCLAHAAWYPDIKFYVGALLVPLSGFAAALMLSRLSATTDLMDRAPRLVMVAAGLPAAVAAIGVATILIRYVPLALEVQRQGETVSRQRLSTPIVGTRQMHADLDQARIACGIPAQASQVVVDGAAYTHLDGISKPIFVYYIHPDIYGKGMDEGLPAFLSGLGSDGVIALERNFPEQLADRAVRVGGVMCIGHEALASEAAK